MTNNHTKKLLTIFTEAAIESLLLKELDRLGVRGYTITSAKGKGHRGTRDAGWDLNSNLRIEIICSHETSETIVHTMQEKFYKNYGMVIYRQEIEVLDLKNFKKFSTTYLVAIKINLCPALGLVGWSLVIKSRLPFSLIKHNKTD